MIVVLEPPCAAPALASLVQFLYEFHTAQAGLVVIAAFVRPRRQLDLSRAIFLCTATTKLPCL
jgi:hypothetical protein